MRVTVTLSGFCVGRDPVPRPDAGAHALVLLGCAAVLPARLQLALDRADPLRRGRAWRACCSPARQSGRRAGPRAHQRLGRRAAPAGPAGARLHAARPGRQDGHPASLRGQPVVFAFVYSTCRDTCPAQVQTIRGALDDLPTNPRRAGRSASPSIPANDTPKRAAVVPAQAADDRADAVPARHAARSSQPVWDGVRDPAAAEDARALRAHRARRRAGRPADRLPVRPPDRGGARARSRSGSRGEWRASTT